MGVWFDNPNIEIGDIFWYNILAQEMSSMRSTNNRRFISIDQEYNTKSCYVELHRNGELKSSQLRRSYYGPSTSGTSGSNVQIDID